MHYPTAKANAAEHKDQQLKNNVNNINNIMRYRPAPHSAEGCLPLGDDRRRLPKQEGKNPSHPYLPTSVPLSPPLQGRGGGRGEKVVRQYLLN